jgi:hypothetical protein
MSDTYVQYFNIYLCNHSIVYLSCISSINLQEGLYNTSYDCEAAERPPQQPYKVTISNENLESNNYPQ